MRRRFGGRVALGLVPVLLSACGGSSSGGSTSAAHELNICQILTKDELNAVMGTQMGLPQTSYQGNDPKQPQCSFTAINGPQSFQIYVDNSSDLTNARNAFPNLGMNQQEGEPSPSPVSSLGDQSRVLLHKNPSNTNAGSNEAVITVLVGSSILTLTVDDSVPPANASVMQKLASKVLSRTDLSKVHA